MKDSIRLDDRADVNATAHLPACARRTNPNVGGMLADMTTTTILELKGRCSGARSDEVVPSDVAAVAAWVSARTGRAFVSKALQIELPPAAPSGAVLQTPPPSNATSASLSAAKKRSVVRLLETGAATFEEPDVSAQDLLLLQADGADDLSDGAVAALGRTLAQQPLAEAQEVVLALVQTRDVDEGALAALVEGFASSGAFYQPSFDLAVETAEGEGSDELRTRALFAAAEMARRALHDRSFAASRGLTPQRPNRRRRRPGGCAARGEGGRNAGGGRGQVGGAMGVRTDPPPSAPSTRLRRLETSGTGRPSKSCFNSPARKGPLRGCAPLLCGVCAGLRRRGGWSTR